MKTTITKTGYYGYALDLDKDDTRKKFYKRQRRKYGFDDTELWSFYTTIAKFILPRLKRFKKTNAGFPLQFSSRKEWNKILRKMIVAFEIIVKDDCSEFSENEKKVKEGLALFSEHFLGLWW